jgi:hypothetical protein
VREIVDDDSLLKPVLGRRIILRPSYVPVLPRGITLKNKDLTLLTASITADPRSRHDTGRRGIQYGGDVPLGETYRREGRNATMKDLIRQAFPSSMDLAPAERASPRKRNDI